MSQPARLTIVPTSDLRVWRDGVELLSPAKSPCPGLYGEGWQKTRAAMVDFLDRFGEQAQDLGWTDLDLFGVHPEIGTVRVDYCGALVLTERPAQAITARTVSFGNLTYYRGKPGKPKGVPIWAVKG